MPRRYLTRLFGGEVRLQMAHVYDVLHAAGIEPQVFYRRLAGQSTTSDIERRLTENEAALRRLEATVKGRGLDGSADA